MLGPNAPSLHLGGNQMLNSPGLRESARVVVMDNIGIFPSVEEQIDFVDQSGYLFGPGMMATINHIPVALHWWKEESRFIDGESIYDVVIYICNKLIPILLKHRNPELIEITRRNEQMDKRTKNKCLTEQTGNKSSSETALSSDSAQNAHSDTNSSGDVGPQNATDGK